LDKAQRRVELQVRLEVLRERELDLHRVRAPIVQDDLLSIELLVDKDVQVVLLFLNVDGDVNAGSLHRDWYWLCVVLVLEEQSKLAEDFCQLHWDEGELDFGAAVTVNFRRSLEAHLGEELFKNVAVGRDVVVLEGDHRRHLGLLVAGARGANRAPAVN